jgi:hypothetical protein
MDAAPCCELRSAQPTGSRARASCSTRHDSACLVIATVLLGFLVDGSTISRRRLPAPAARRSLAPTPASSAARQRGARGRSIMAHALASGGVATLLSLRPGAPVGARGSRAPTGAAARLAAAWRAPLSGETPAAALRAAAREGASGAARGGDARRRRGAVRLSPSACAADEGAAPAVAAAAVSVEGSAVPAPAAYSAKVRALPSARAS